MQKITPNLWFPGNAQQAAEFYTRVFPDSRISQYTHYPSDGLPEFQRGLEGKVLTVDFELAGLAFTGINAGREFAPTPASSFFVNFDPSRDDHAREHLDALWGELLQDGQVLMPLDAYPFSPHYGWVQDRFGFSWQVILTDPRGEPRPTIVPSLLFGGPAQNRAREAIDYYTSVFEDTRVGTVAPYPQDTGPARGGSVMFGEYQLAGQWFAAMDSGAPQDFTFTEAVSYSVACADQAEIDRYWGALSRVPEAEQCGWCKDQFGVSWQVVPAVMEELMARPGAYDRLLSMKKLVIADF